MGHERVFDGRKDLIHAERPIAERATHFARSDALTFAMHENTHVGRFGRGRRTQLPEVDGARVMAIADEERHDETAGHCVLDNLAHAADHGSLL